MSPTTTRSSDPAPKRIEPEKLRIPTLCPAVGQLMALPAETPDHFDTVLRIVSKDPGLTAELLRVSRSALFGSKPPPVEVVGALVRVGARRFVSLLFSTSLSSLFAPPRGPVSRYWRHSLLTGCLARRLASRLRPPGVDPEWTFSLGILHNVGGLVLAANDSAGYARMLALHPVDSIELRVAEAAAYGADHCAIGERVCAEWKLPESAAVVAGGHHGAPVDADSVSAACLAVVRHALRLAELVDPAAGDADATQPAADMDEKRFPRIASLAPDDLRRILDVGRVEHADICRQFGLSSGDA
jgi:HD-like signal output (HDOD) protein